MVITCLHCSADLRIPGDSGFADALPSKEFESPYPRADQIPVTSANLTASHEVIGMVSFFLGTRGGMAAEFEQLKKIHDFHLKALRLKGHIKNGSGVGQTVGGISVDADGDIGLGINYAGASFRSDDIDAAFYISVYQLQFKAAHRGANAVVGFRFDVDFDSHSNVINFFASAYGTAVKTLPPKTEEPLADQARTS